MKRAGWLPFGLLAGLCASYGASAVIGWFWLRHYGFSQPDPLLMPGMSFWNYFGSRFFVWDGQWYDVIARVGYHWHRSETARQSLAFFPLWGLVIRPIYTLVSWQQHLWVVLLTVIVAYGSIHVFFRLGQRLVGERAAVIATVLYVFFPSGHYLLESYPTALMNLIALLVLRDVVDGREWRPALIAGIGTAAGPMMVVPAFTVWLVAAWRRRNRVLQSSTLLLLLGLGVLALSGLLAFVAWQGVALHDPFAFLMAQKPWDQPRGVGARLWRFTWMMLVVPDIYHIGRLMFNFVGQIRAGDYTRAFVSYEFAVNFLFMVLLMAGLFWTIATKPRVIVLYGCLVVVFYIWFHGTTYNGISTMRLLYICTPGFWGLGRALQREPVWAWGTIGLSVAALVVQEVCSDTGQLVL